ncbi:MAG TPA: pyridoxal-dependent decarboxylase [Gemmatimonadaceae bacterium]
MPTDSNPLQLSPEAMRAFGHRVVDVIVDHLETLRDRRVAIQKPRAELDAVLGSFADAPASPDDVLTLVEREVMGAVTAVDHPRFYAFVPAPGSFVGAMADALSSGFNVFAGHWLAAAGAGAVELQTIDLLRRACMLPEGAGGLFVSGGSMANLSGLAAARAVKLGGPDPAAIVYLSDQAHSSIAKGLRVLGFANHQVKSVAVDDALRMNAHVLATTIADDRARGLKPFCVVASAGTTNTGAVDPLVDLSAICRANDMWLHVDGAYGAAAALTDRGRAALPGLDLADSIALDPHKWLFQPFEIGCVLVRDFRHLHLAFAVHPEDNASYLADVGRVAEREVVFYEHGVQLTRSFRALKLWMSLRIFGLAAFRAAIDRGIALAEEVEQMLRADGCFEVVTPAQLSVVTFAPRLTSGTLAEANARVERAVERLIADGYAMVTSTQVRGRTVLRFCLIHPDAQLEEVRQTTERLARYCDE